MKSRTRSLPVRCNEANLTLTHVVSGCSAQHAQIFYIRKRETKLYFHSVICKLYFEEPIVHQHAFSYSICWQPIFGLVQTLFVCLSSLCGCVSMRWGLKPVFAPLTESDASEMAWMQSRTFLPQGLIRPRHRKVFTHEISLPFQLLLPDINAIKRRLLSSHVCSNEISSNPIPHQIT